MHSEINTVTHWKCESIHSYVQKEKKEPKNAFAIFKKFCIWEGGGRNSHHKSHNLKKYIYLRNGPLYIYNYCFSMSSVCINSFRFCCTPYR